MKNKTDDFVHLHTHSTYSFLDGFSLPDRMVNRVVEMGQQAIALSDHGQIGGLVDMKLACEKYGVKFIPACEFYIIPFGEDHTYRVQGSANHILIIAYNQVGYQNILKLTELSNSLGFYYRPRITYEWLELYNEGLIITSGCMASEICSNLNSENGQGPTGNNYQKVGLILNWAYDIFGLDRFYIELQDHNIPALRSINRDLNWMNERYGFDYILTNDAHYVSPSDAVPHSNLLCINTNCTINHPNSFVQMYRDNPDYFLTSGNEMLKKDYGFNISVSAMTNTVKISDMVEKINLGYESEVKKYRFPIMREYSNYDLSLDKIARAGFAERYDPSNKTAKDKFEYELSIIKKLGFSPYFLCVMDVIDYCHSKGIVTNTRGSACGSLVSYSLGITYIDPLEYGLIFERFLNPDRVSAPDIDLDVPPNNRSEVIKYLTDKYGADYVAQVITFSYIKDRQALRDAAKITENEFSVGGSIIKQMEDEAFTPGQLTDDEKQVFNIASGLMGQIRGSGVHAGAVLLSDEPLVNNFPLVRPKTNSGATTHLLVGFDYNTAEMLGGIKLDLLGVESLEIIQKTINDVNARFVKSYTLENIPIDDKLAFDVLNSGLMAEIFQLSGNTAKEVCRKIKPETVFDIMIITSLARPGPLQYVDLYADRKHGLVKVVYDHPDLEDLLSDTYAIIVFQESVMEVVKKIAGFTNSQADMVRKAMSKKKGLDKMQGLFLSGGKERGYTESFLNKLWNDLIEFSAYAFNLAHAASYSMVTIKMAYLKAHYPLEFYCAALNSRSSDLESVAAIVREMRLMGIKLLPPIIGKSDLYHYKTRGNNQIMFPISGVKNVGLKKVSILADIDPVATNIHDFIAKNGPILRKIGITALESLIKVGAFDEILEDREWLLKNSKAIGQGAIIEQASLFPSNENPKFNKNDFLYFEKELCGTFMTGHPLDNYKNAIPFANLSLHDRGVFPGIINSVRFHNAKNGMMAFVSIEDITGTSIPVVVFADTFVSVEKRLIIGNVVRVLGYVSSRNDELQIIAQNVI